MKEIHNTSKLNPLILVVLAMTFTGLTKLSNAQVLNHITISPANPTSTDSIKIITDFSYFGNCSFGMVYSYSSINDSVIYIAPTYCGYGDSTLCTSIDTLTLGPFQEGNYILTIDFHQGSICPISDFDTQLVQFDTTLMVGVPTSTNFIDFFDFRNPSINLYPNPFSVSTTFSSERALFNASIHVFDASGKIVKRIPNISGSHLTIQREDLKQGLYFYQLIENKALISKGKFVIVDE